MNWKKFLKPDWRKIVIFGIIIAILIVVFGIPICEFGARCPRLEFISINDYIDTSAELQLLEDIIPRSRRGLWFGWSILIFELIGSYILSCLTIWYYSKTKKKKLIK